MPKQEGEVAHLENELAFYSSYHSNKINKLIHFFFIPQILWSGMMILDHYTFSGFNNVDLAPGLSYRPSLGMGLAFAFQMYYVILDEFIGGTYIPVMALMYLTGQYLTAHVPEWLPLRTAFGPVPSALPFALAVHFHGWAWQFLGHFKFEGRAPALFDNLTQALVTAPFFVHVEALFFFFNWNPALHKRIQNATAKRIVAMNQARRANDKKSE